MGVGSYLFCFRIRIARIKRINVSQKAQKTLKLC